MDPTSSGSTDGFMVVFVLMAVFIAVGAVVTAVTKVRGAGMLRRGGVDPVNSKEQLEVQLSQRLRGQENTASGPRSTLKDRLSELDDLRALGAISEAEHAAARARLLGTLPD